MSSPRLHRALALAAVAIAMVVLSACGGSSPVTRARLERSLPQSFENQYVRQATILGHEGITTASLHARAQCDKGGPTVPDEGLGADWICFMDWKDPNVPIPDGSAKFELNVHSNNCYTTTGPTKLVGLRTITNSHGTFVDNPVFEFDTCFDAGSSNEPTHVIFPPASLVLPSGTVKAEAGGDLAPLISCTVGPLGCSGSVTARLGSHDLGRTTYSLAPGGASALRFAAPEGARGKLTLVATSTVGRVTDPRVVLTVP